MTSSATSSLLFAGLDGANPLAFLATLGAWRMADRFLPGSRLGWTRHGGHWAPVLHHDGLGQPVDPDAFIARLDEELRKPRAQAIFAEITIDGRKVPPPDDLNKIDAADFSARAQAALAGWSNGEDPDGLAMLAALASDGHVDDATGLAADTAFRTMSGAGHQHFLKTMRDLAAQTTADHLRAALLAPWTYAEEKLGLRFDPLEDKRYALAWKNPSQDVTMTERGANRLAFEGLPLLPVMPGSNHLETTGFSGHRASDTAWTWPLWEPPVDLGTARSLLALGALQDLPSAEPTDAPPRARTGRITRSLHARGIVTAYRSRRITIGKFRNFTPATPIA